MYAPDWELVVGSVSDIIRSSSGRPTVIETVLYSQHSAAIDADRAAAAAAAAAAGQSPTTATDFLRRRRCLYKGTRAS